MRKVFKFVGIYLALSLIVGLVWAAFAYPIIPDTLEQWIWLFVLALPLQLALEWIGELLQRNRVTRYVEQRTAARSFSIVRMCYLMVFILFFTAIILGIGYAWRTLGQ